MNRLKQKRERNKRRKLRIRRSINGTKSVPRLSVYKSNRNIYIQAIDDENGNTLCTASTREKDLADLGIRKADAEKLGQVFGERLKSQKIKTVVFDRNGNLYHGVIKAVADGARKAGIEF